MAVLAIVLVLALVAASVACACYAYWYGWAQEQWWPSQAYHYASVGSVL